MAAAAIPHPMARMTRHFTANNVLVSTKLNIYMYLYVMMLKQCCGLSV